MIGIVGGSGLYHLDGLTDTRWVRVESPFGAPSDEILRGRLGEHEVAFLPRHGRGHRIPPHEINFLANIDALKRVGVTQLISVSAVGSLKAELPPGTFVLVDQFIDRTLRGPKTFFGTGLVAHVSIARPVCARLLAGLRNAAEHHGLPTVTGGTYLAMEGPQFSTLAESNLHRSLGASVVGMTNMPEAKLAREAELCYATVAMVTDFDCWRTDHAHVEVTAILAVLTSNAAHARGLLSTAIPRLGTFIGPCPEGCDRALDTAIITSPDARDPALVAKLDAIARRVLRGGQVHGS
jgi:5'-methylthioadenosine phosphorylase